MCFPALASHPENLDTIFVFCHYDEGSWHVHVGLSKRGQTPSQSVYFWVSDFRMAASLAVCACVCLCTNETGLGLMGSGQGRCKAYSRVAAIC